MLNRTDEKNNMTQRITELDQEHERLKEARQQLYIRLKEINKEKIRLQMKLNLR